MYKERKSNFPWLEDLLSYFLGLKEIDDEIELIRVNLCQISQFSPQSLFEYLDIDFKSFLTLNDFISFLRAQNTTYDDKKLRKMIHNFDKDNDFSLNLDEFLGLILPKKNSILQKNMLSIINSYNQCNNNIITQEMKITFNDLILREMKLIEELDQISAKIKNSKIFSTYEAFTSIVRDDKYITKLNLYNFLKNNGAYINDNEVVQLMFRLDSDNDDRISYEEFKEMFYPLKEDFVYTPKNDANNNIFSYSEKYERKKKYNFFNNNDNYNTDSKYQDYNNDNKDDEFDIKDNEFDNNYKKDDDYNINENNQGKKGKKTKKVILKPGKNSDNNSNLIRSQEPNSNYLRNNPQETEASYSKFPDINNNNSTDNYTLNNRISKYNNYSFSKNYKNNVPSYNNEDNINEYKYNSKVTQESLEINNNYPSRKNKYSSNHYYNEENKIDDNYDNEINNYESNNILRNRNKKLFSPLNLYDNNNHNHNITKCKGCLYTAKNIYNDYQCKNYINNPRDNNHQFTEFKSQIKNSNIFKNKNRFTQLNDIYKTKDDLIKKYGNNNNNNRNNYFYSSEENISSNRCFSSPRNDFGDNNENNISNKNSNNYFSPPSLTNINNKDIDNDEDKRNKNRKTFAERFQKIKENKIPYNNFNNYSPPSNLRQFKPTINLKGNNIKDKKDLLFKLLVNYIEQDNKLEKVKESLGNCSDSTLPKIFELFNINKKNIICSSDLYETLNSLSKSGSFSPNEIKYVFKKYNKPVESGFNYDEFCKIILPRKISSKIIMENRNNENNELENETINKVVELFEIIIEGEKSSEEIRSMLSMISDNIFYDIFGEIKKENKPGIQKDDIDSFMRRGGYDIKDYEIEIIMEKMDKNKDNIIDYEEFISEVQPKIL